MTLKFRPKSEQVHLIYSDGPQPCMSHHGGEGKVFAVIGPFQDFTDKPDLMDTLETLCRGYNVVPE